MTSFIKKESEHLKVKANEIRAKIDELLRKPETPDYDEKLDSLNASLDNIINEITLNEN